MARYSDFNCAAHRLAVNSYYCVVSILCDSTHTLRGPGDRPDSVIVPGQTGHRLKLHGVHKYYVIKSTYNALQRAAACRQRAKGPALHGRRMNFSGCSSSLTLQTVPRSSCRSTEVPSST